MSNRQRRRRRPSRGAGRSSGASQQQPETRLRVEHIPPRELVPWVDNPRTITKAELEKLKRSIRSFGFVQPVVANRRTRGLVGGHQRVKAAEALGVAAVPVVFVDLPDAQAKALALALRIQGEWEVSKLGAILTELQQLPDVDVALTGFDDKEIERILAELERQQLPSPYEETAHDAFDLQRQNAPTRVRPGETWRLGRHLLHCGDSLAEGRLVSLLEGQQVDYSLTDPPYGIAYQGTAPRGRRKASIQNDDADQFPEFIDKAVRAIREVMAPGATLHMFCGASGPKPVLATAMQAVSDHFSLQGLLVWDRVDPGLGWRWRRSFEGIIEASVGKPRIWNGGRDSRDILRYPRAVPQASEHPTPKPVGLLEELTRACSPHRGVVLDPFCGGGSTLIAAERTGRRCIGVEIEARYADLALARFEALGDERAVRVATGEDVRS